MSEESPQQDRERRGESRRHLVFYLRVLDGMSNRILGHLVDISSGGLMLISDMPVSENQQVSLRVRLPKEIDGRSEIMLDAVSLWCRRDANPDFYIAGFKLRQPEHEHVALIRQLIEDFSMEETQDAGGQEHPACNLTHRKRG